MLINSFQPHHHFLKNRQKKLPLLFAYKKGFLQNHDFKFFVFMILALCFLFAILAYFQKFFLNAELQYEAMFLYP